MTVALSCLYQVVNNGGNSQGFPAAASYSLPAPSLFDVGVDDATTYYTATAPGGASSFAYVFGLLSFSAATTVTACRVTFLSDHGGTVYVLGSNDGTAWTSLKAFGGSVPGTITRASSISGTYKYYAASLASGGSGSTQQTVQMSDFRLYDSAGALITVASFGSLPSAPLAVQYQPGQTQSTSVPIYPPDVASGATTQRIQRAPDVGGSPGTFADVAGQPSPYQAGVRFYDTTGVAQLTTYWYRAVATNGSGETAGPASSYTTPGTMPPAPTLTNNGNYAAPTATVYAPSSFLGYASQMDAQRLGADGSTWTTVGTALPEGGQFTDTAPVRVSGGAFHYRLRATESGPNSGGPVLVAGPDAFTDIASPPPPSPDTPPAPTFNPPTTSEVDVLIPALGANTTSYSLLRQDTPGGAFNPIATGLTGSTVYPDTGLATSTTYSYRFVAVGPGGSVTGPYASTMTTAPDTTPPTFSSASVNAAGNAITWVFADPTSAGLLPAAPTGLSATADGAALALGAATVSGMTVTTPVSGTPVASGATVLGSYAPGNLTDNAAVPNAVLAFANQPIANNSMQAMPLTVAFVSPPNGSAVQGLVTVRAQASGGLMGVARVELYAQGGLVDTVTAPTTGNFYDLHWDTSPSGNGDYTLVAKAYDHAAPAQVATSAPLMLSASNPGRLAAGYWFGEPQTPEAGKTILTAVATANLVPTGDARQLRAIQFGVHVPGDSVDFGDYTSVALNQDFALPGAGDTYRLAARLSPRFAMGPVTFTRQIVKLTALGAGGLLWASDGTLWSFDAASSPALLLDMAPRLMAGETIQDVCAAQGRVYLALAGGAAPLTTRLFAFDPVTGDESYTLALGLGSPLTALTATADGTLFIGTQSGQVHTLSPSGTLRRVVGGSTASLPSGVVRLLPLALAQTNALPGVAALLADGSVWDISAANAVYGAVKIYNPASGQGATAGAVADTKYLGTADGTLFGLDGSYQPVYTFPHGVNALAAYMGTLLAGLSADGRLWGKVLSPGAHALAYAPATDPLDGVTSITSLLALGGSLFVGCVGSGNTLFRYEAPPASATTVLAKSFRQPAVAVRSFA